MMNRKIYAAMGLVFFLGVAAGCGSNIFEGIEDKESSEAKQYANLKSLDSGDFQTVLEACFDADGNLVATANATDCSAAALGAAGLDPIKIAQELNNLIGTTSTGDISAISSFQGITLDSSYLGDIHKANAGLAEDCNDPANADASQACSQLVVTSIAEVVIAIAQVGDANGINVSDGIDNTEAQAIADVINAGEPTVDAGTGTPILVSEVVEGAALDIVNNVDRSPLAGTKLGNVIQEQVNTIGGADCAPTADPAGCTVTSNELETYLNTQFGQ